MPRRRSACRGRSTSKRAASRCAARSRLRRSSSTAPSRATIPTTVCGVVYQNAHRHLACQFTFACDGMRDVVTEPDMWDRAKKIAKEMLDGRLWLPEVQRRRTITPTGAPVLGARDEEDVQAGVHAFYRPRQLGRRQRAPSWGNARRDGGDRSEASRRRMPAVTIASRGWTTRYRRCYAATSRYPAPRRNSAPNASARRTRHSRRRSRRSRRSSSR